MYFYVDDSIRPNKSGKHSEYRLFLFNCPKNNS